MDLLDDDGLLDIRRRGSRTDPRAALNELGERREIPDSNHALTDWAANLGRPRAAVRTGSCSMCESPGRYTCNQCKSAACAADYWLMFGLCRNCAKDERVRRFHQTPEPEARNWLGGDP